jgi:hypothetical protein
MLVPSSLVREPTQLATPRRSGWGPKARRWYQRVLSGVTHHQANRRRLRVMTLTTSPEGRARCELGASWGTLLKRIRRRWVLEGFEYWKLRTSEGHGVLHIIFSGPYIPHAWLTRTWKEIHFSPVVYLQELRYRRKRLISYLMTHYLPAHDEPSLYTRMSWSWGWVFRGFAGAWRYFWRRGPTIYDAIHNWNKLMSRSDPHTSYKRMRGNLWKQTKLKKGGIIVSVESYPPV